jgi:hypothetical protein
MIPQNYTWSTENIGFYLNGTAGQLWPTILTALDTGGPGCNSQPDAVRNPHCAAGGYLALRALRNVEYQSFVGLLFHRGG